MFSTKKIKSIKFKKIKIFSFIIFVSFLFAIPLIVNNVSTNEITKVLTSSIQQVESSLNVPESFASSQSTATAHWITAAILFVLSILLLIPLIKLIKKKDKNDITNNSKNNIVILDDFEQQNVRANLDRELKQQELLNKVSATKPLEMLFPLFNLIKEIAYQSNNNHSLNNTFDNVNDVIKDFTNLFKSENVQLIDPLPGEHFDYKIHEVVDTAESNIFQKDEIIEVLKVGYKLNNRLVMAAWVKVAK